MEVLIWVGVALLVLVFFYVIIVAAFSFYVSSPSTHNATAYDRDVSN